MKNIEEKVKNKYSQLLSSYSKKLKKKNIEDQDISILCRDVAEVLVITEEIVPKHCKNLNILDFHGYNNAECSLTVKEVLRAKNLLCKYCWGIGWEDLKKQFKDEEQILLYLQKFNKLEKRFDNDNNVMIFGDNLNKKIGKTLVASLIMKEAIRLRLFNRYYRSQTYDWVDFSILRHNLMDKDAAVKINYAYDDWLVVDNIPNLVETGASASFLAYLQEILNAFFLERINANLNTILVFNFDIRKYETTLLKDFGIAIKKIYEEPDTCKIPLTKKDF